jgi:Cys-tRNA(Pro)/Cys-tRNA(Cys) deacylase
MRILDSLHLSYEQFTYECDEFIDGIQIADKLKLPHERVFKTLVTQGSSGNYFVFVIPIEAELDMKKAAKSVGEKSVAMLHVKDINKVTGYIRGGCTAIGMKKQYVTRLAKEAEALDKIYVSGGRIGSQILIAPGDLLKASDGEYGEITKNE